jgi:hypothetical protein
MRRLARTVAIFVALFVAPFASGSDEASSPVEPNRPSFDQSWYGGGNGLSKEAAIVLNLKGAPRHADLVGALEYAWILHHYPSSRPVAQALPPQVNGQRYDVITLETKSGENVTLWFDISDAYK